MHAVELGAQLGDVLPIHERFHQVVLGHFLTLDQAFDEAVTAQQLPDLVQVGFEVLELFLLFGLRVSIMRAKPFAMKQRLALYTARLRRFQQPPV
jgi:hypothetical protein